MDWLVGLFRDPHHAYAVPHAVLMLALVAACGLALGSLKVARLNLGVAGVLFAGLAFGHLGFGIDHRISEFAREFGLILFVYTIGVQVGPGFLASLRRQGLPLNLMAAGVVLLGVGITAAIAVTRFPPEQRPVAVGILAGATTNTPSLGAATAALKDAAGVPQRTKEDVGKAYAVAYPFGILGIILAMLLIRAAFRITPRKEQEQLDALAGANASRLQTMTLEVRNANLDGVPLRDVPTIGQSGVVVSRILQGGAGARPQVARGDTTVKVGDVLLAVGPREGLEDFKLVVGHEVQADLRAMPGELTSRRVLVSRSAALGRAVQDLDPLRRFGVVVTRIHRSEVELPPTTATRLQFGDNLVVVGEPDGIRQFASEVGDSVKQLNHPQVIPLFLGIALGVLLGSWPIHLPGMPTPLKLGLAGGPLLVAIILSRVGNIGSLVWYMPISANFMLRELGIVLFLASVGLKSGEGFLQTLRGPGLEWMLYGALITFVPLMVVALIARIFLKVNYLSLCGLLAGSMTDPPALAFAGTMTGSEAPSVSYATVYPLVMLLRVLSAQTMVLMLLR